MKVKEIIQLYRRLRAREETGSQKYHGWQSALYVVRLDYGMVFLLIVLAAGLAIIFLRVNPGGRFVYDDSYITLKFAQNLLRYGRFTFDGGPSSSGATSPLHVILIALLALIFGRVDLAAFFLGVATLAGASAFCYYWAREVSGSRRTGFLTGLLFVSSGWMVFDALSGLETVLFIMLLLLALFLFEKRNRWFGIPLALNIMTRPEGWFFVAGLVVFVAVRQLPVGSRLPRACAAKPVRHRSFREIRELGLGMLIFGICLVPFLLLNYSQTGSILPDTATAKTYFFGEIGMPLSKKWTFFWDTVRFFYTKIIIPWPLIIPVALILARRFWSRFYILVALGGFALAYLLMFPGSPKHYWCRYQHIFIPFVLFAIAEGSINAVHWAGRYLNRYLGLAGVVTGMLVASLVLGNQLLSLQRQYAIYRGQIRSTREVGEELARFVMKYTQRGDVVATHDVGILGYFTDRPILDLVGLVNPEVRPYYRDAETGELIPVYQRNVLDYIRIRMPRLLIMFPDWKLFLNFDPEKIPEHFVPVYQSKPVFPFTTGGYRVYEVKP